MSKVITIILGVLFVLMLNNLRLEAKYEPLCQADGYVKWGYNYPWKWGCK